MHAFPGSSVCLHPIPRPAPIHDPQVANFFTYFKNAFALYVRRHHEAEEKVYLPWIKTRVEVPARISEDHEVGHFLPRGLRLRYA